MPKHIGNKIKKIRKEKGLSLEMLSSKSKVSKSFIWDIENHVSLKPSAEKLIAIADSLDVNVYYFFENDTRNPKQKHLDEGFFRKYKKLNSKKKEQLMKILEIIKGHDRK